MDKRSGIVRPNEILIDGAECDKHSNNNKLQTLRSVVWLFACVLTSGTSYRKPTA